MVCVNILIIVSVLWARFRQNKHNYKARTTLFINLPSRPLDNLFHFTKPLFWQIKNLHLGPLLLYDRNTW